MENHTNRCLCVAYTYFTTFFKYLGVQVTSCPLDFCHLNISLLLQWFRDRSKIWNALRLSAGKVNLIKMILMPQLLYCFLNAPMVILLKIFRIVNSLFCTLIWKTEPPRIKLEHLLRPQDYGGLALPNPCLN